MLGRQRAGAWFVLSMAWIPSPDCSERLFKIAGAAMPAAMGEATAVRVRVNFANIRLHVIARRNRHTRPEEICRGLLRRPGFAPML